MDDALVIWFNGQARRHARAAALVGLAAERLAAMEVGLLLLMALSGRRGSAIRMLAAVAAVYATSEGLGRLVPRERPFERLPRVKSLAYHEPGRSFPSRHVASGLAMASIGHREHTRLGGVMALVAIALGVSRVTAGLHYPSDVAAGVILGLFVGGYARKA